MRVGYARVSTTDQSPELQLEALRRAGCERVFTERASGARDDRPELARIVDDMLRAGDTPRCLEAGPPRAFPEDAHHHGR